MADLFSRDKRLWWETKELTAIALIFNTEVTVLFFHSWNTGHCQVKNKKHENYVHGKCSHVSKCCW